MNRLHMANVVVIGGGYVGQLVQWALPGARILDWRKVAPMNHLETRVGPQYLWEPIPGLPYHSFPVITLVDGTKPERESILAYKRKIGKQEDGGDWGLQFQHQTVGWHSELPIPNIEYNRHVVFIDLAGHKLRMKDDEIIPYDVLINTIPLDSFLRMCLIAPRVFDPWKQDPIYITREPIIDEDARAPQMVLNYLSDPDISIYRSTSVVAGHLQVRFHESLRAMPDSRKLLPGKIHPHVQSEDVLESLRDFDTFCFGRYATWRPDELAHETWKHIAEWKGTL